ncbi:MAG: hypothetical protein EBX52_04025 [Proteobacteria bacterium]|nr:hypothetical protein [Pseudomonadota bacterium]
MTQPTIKTRANYLINPRFQWMIIRWALLISLLNSLIFILACYAFFRRLIVAGIQLNISPDAPYFQVLMNEKARMVLIFSLTTFLSICMILGFGVYLSHRIAGPIFNLKRYLKENDPNGDLPDLKFRKQDFFQELAVDFNAFKSKINRKT